ncbi:MAG: CDGSH iron-sulfur domain-containing protein [Myxococcota bacterium]
MSDRLSVHVIPDGPLKISGANSAQYGGERLQIEGDLYFCRCGESSNAPFCDGSHNKVGFKGTSESPPQDEIRVWEGQTIRTFFNKKTCMHVFYCKPLKALRERELAGDASAAAEIMKVISTCPSGALSYEMKTEEATPAIASGPVCIDVIEGGEIRVQVDFDINVPMQERQATNRATLCRCGLSKNKPWCDGRHKAKRDFR